MSIEILMPALSPTMTEGNLTKWIIKEGDRVKAGDILAEIETDKATMEVEAVDEGVVKQLLVKEGQESVKVNTPIAILFDVKDSMVNQTDSSNDINQNTPKAEINRLEHYIPFGNQGNFVNNDMVKNVLGRDKSLGTKSLEYRHSIRAWYLLYEKYKNDAKK